MNWPVQQRAHHTIKVRNGLIPLRGWNVLGSAGDRDAGYVRLHASSSWIETAIPSSGIPAKQWMAVFAVSNGSTIGSVAMVPFLRLGTPTGNVFPLIECCEGQTTDGVSYTIASNAWTGEALVCTETADDGGGPDFSGRVCTITANSSSTVTISDPGTLAEGDVILPRPPGWWAWTVIGVYQGDTGSNGAGEPRNFTGWSEIIRSDCPAILIPHTRQTGTNARKATPLVDGSWIDAYSNPAFVATVYNPTGSAPVVTAGVGDSLTAYTAFVEFAGLVPPIATGVHLSLGGRVLSYEGAGTDNTGGLVKFQATFDAVHKAADMYWDTPGQTEWREAFQLDFLQYGWQRLWLHVNGSAISRISSLLLSIDGYTI